MQRQAFREKRPAGSQAREPLKRRWSGASMALGSEDDV
jgi:hypothetical protein